jgi:hypothetical protein
LGPGRRSQPESERERSDGPSTGDAMAASGYPVYRSYDEAGGIRDEVYALARRYRGIVKLAVVGRTFQGREIIALKVTKNANQHADGARPATLYMSTVHAREWVGTEVSRRLLHHFVENDARNAESGTSSTRASCGWHDGRLLVRDDRRVELDARARRGLRRLRLPLPRRRGARAGRVRAQSRRTR